MTASGMDVPKQNKSAWTEQVHVWLAEKRSTTVGPWVVAVSGGVDSMSLLHDLTRHPELWPDGGLLAVHVNHGLRPEADQDAELVADTCRRFGIPVRFMTIALSDIPPAERRGIEADARRMRYAALREAALAAGSNTVLLGHHADDQMETMLWRLVRGTALTGFAGIRRCGFRDGIRWLRPWLDVEKATLLAYAKTNQVPYIEDKTNDFLEYTRNRIRHQVVPVLRDLNPRVAEAFARHARIAQEEDAWLQSLAGQAAAEIMTRTDDGRVCIHIPRLRTFPLPLQRRAITIILYCLPFTDWTSRHVAQVMQLCASRRPSASAPLTGAIQAWRDYDDLWIGLPPVASGHPEAFTWRLADGAVLAFPNTLSEEHWEFCCRGWRASEGVRVAAHDEAIFPPLESVVVRPPEPGDRVAPLGMSGTRKLQDVFVDAKVPRIARQAWPVVCVDGEIVWVPGLIRSRAALVTGETAGWRLQARRVPAGDCANG
ncbi:MAG: tRNA lysidine(34) synthetase TilS [Alicyclobacillus sp.]|nr:tRNA lysidine(34) synthetase TilS [Alicyclobacillus sp.]